MSQGTSLIDIGQLSEPATVLIKKVSKLVGGFFEPYQMKRIAKAEAEAALVKAQSEIQITDLHRRAMHRFVDEEAHRQQNIEDITGQALPQLTEGAKPDNMDDDWIANFFDKSRIVSDTEMQNLWSRVLAGEANSPGTYSRRTVNALADLDKFDAQLFSHLCAFNWRIGTLVPLVFDLNAKIYTANGVNHDTLRHLDSIGLIQFHHMSGFVHRGLPKKLVVSYHKTLVPLQMAQETDNELDVGRSALTKTGLELSRVCGGKPVPGFIEYVLSHWMRARQTTPSEQPTPASPPNTT